MVVPTLGTPYFLQTLHNLFRIIVEMFRTISNFATIGPKYSSFRHNSLPISSGFKNDFDITDRPSASIGFKSIDQRPASLPSDITPYDTPYSKVRIDVCASEASRCFRSTFDSPVNTRFTVEPLNGSASSTRNGRGGGGRRRGTAPCPACQFLKCTTRSRWRWRASLIEFKAAQIIIKTDDGLKKRTTRAVRRQDRAQAGG